MSKKESAIKEEILSHLRAINKLRNDLSGGEEVTPEDARIWELILAEKDKILDLVMDLFHDTKIDYIYNFCVNNFDSFMKTIFTKKELTSIKVEK